MTMNKYDEYYDFRLANKNDVDAIMLFFKKEWGENHILATNKEFFIWQYGNEEYGDEEHINFVLMTEKNGEIAGITGFIPYSKGSSSRYVTGSMLKVRGQGLLPMAGVELEKRRMQLVPYRCFYASGVNPRTNVPLHKHLYGAKVGMMTQYYILNTKLKEYKIAGISYIPEKKRRDKKLYLRRLDNIEEMNRVFDYAKKYDKQAIKSREYIAKRYWNHPVYQYELHAVYDINKRCVGIVIGREIGAEKTYCYRVVDYLGDTNYIGELDVPLTEIMESRKYEFIDFQVALLPKEIMQNSNFCVRKENDDNIIPSYFEPFVKENINIWFVSEGEENVVIFKGDADQDRPNMIKRENDSVRE